MSFFLTQDQIRNGTKTVTRRNGWKFIKAGDIVNACVKCQGLKKGQKVEKIRPIKIISSTFEPLGNMTPEEVVKEGFPDWTVSQFIDLYCKANKGTTEATLINRIEFEYLTNEEVLKLMLESVKCEDVINSFWTDAGIIIGELNPIE